MSRARLRKRGIQLGALLGLAAAALGGCGGGADVPAGRGGPVAPPEGLSAPALHRLLHDGSAPATVVNVWATWCLPCREEFPDLVQLEREFRPRGVRVVLISADFPDRRGEVEAFLGEHGVGFRTFLKEGADMEFIDTLSPQWSGALPGTFVFDAAGALAWWFEGKTDLPTLRGVVETVLKKSETRRS